MLVLHPGLFHVEQFSQGFNRAESLVRIGWAGKRPGGSQRPPPQAEPPSRHIMGPEADEEPPAADAWLRMQRDSSGMWAALRIDSREPAALPAVRCRWRRVFCVCQVICCSYGCCVAAFSPLSWRPPGLAGGWSAQLQARSSCRLPVRFGWIFRRLPPASLSQGFR